MYVDETSRKKKQLNEAEIALRREETARKRKHLSEKKLEDEKVRIYTPLTPLCSLTRCLQAETINRLLKKKSGTRSRRNALASADDRTPATQTGGNGTPAEGEPEEEESGEVVPVPIIEVVPTCYRWISTTRPAADAPPGDEKMTMSFSVPASLLPMPFQDGDEDIKTEVQARAPAVCNVDGCTAIRKYRLVRDSERGACGMGHLHLLETQPRAVAI